MTVEKSAPANITPPRTPHHSPARVPSTSHPPSATISNKKGLTKRLQGLQMLKAGHDIVSVAGSLEVTPRTVRNWRRSL